MEATRGRSQTTLTRFWLFFDHLPPFVDIFYLMNVDKKSTFLDHLPPLLVDIVCERPPTAKQKAKATLQGRPALVRSDFVVWLEVELNFYFLLYFGFLAILRMNSNVMKKYPADKNIFSSSVTKNCLNCLMCCGFESEHLGRSNIC